MHMSYGMFGRLAGVVACMAMLVSASGCMPDASAPANRPTSGDETDMPLGGASRTGSSGEFGTVTAGTDTYRGFVLDNVLHSPDDGDIHFNLYVPDSYDGSRPVALFLTLSGYQGLYFQGVGENLYTEDFGFEAQRYDDRMIIAAPQLSDWGRDLVAAGHRADRIPAQRLHHRRLARLRRRVFGRGRDDVARDGHAPRPILRISALQLAMGR